MPITDYVVDETIYQSSNSIISRGTERTSGRPVIIKVLPGEFPRAETLARFKREFTMTKRLQAPGVIEALALEPSGNSLAIVLEDFGGRSLQNHLRERELTLREVLTVGAAVARALSVVHAGQVMHKDIDPANIVWNRETGAVKLIDFGISTELSRETPSVLNPNVL